MGEERTLFAALRAVARRDPAGSALIEGGTVRSYGWLLTAVEDLAGRLRVGGVGRGSVVALVLPNGTEFAAAFFAVAATGGIVLPLNPALSEVEIAALLADASVSMILAGPPQAARCRRASALGGAAPRAIVLDVADLGAMASAPAGPAPSAEPPTDPALCLYSSGSTGRPKRVLRSHANLLYETDRLVAAFGLSPSDRVLGVAPFSHVNGLMRSMVAAFLAGATLVPMAKFERHAVARAIREHAISVIVGVPFMFSLLADSRWPGPVDFRSLRLSVSSSAPLPPLVSQRFRDRYGIYVRQLYGTTETGTIAVSLDAQVEAFLASVGTPLPGVEVRVFSEDGTPLPAGETGQIGIRSPAAATAYADQPDATATAFVRGYFFPGDVGWADADGRLYLAGRTSLFINRGGFKVNPYEVEDVLQQHPKVGDVAVVGVEAPLGDQKVKAIVVATEPCEPTEIVDFCQGRLADYKIPSIVEFRAELPKSSAGKTLRGML